MSSENEQVMVPPQSGSRMIEQDIGKGISILFVIAIHCIPLTENAVFNLVADYVLREAKDLFRSSTDCFLSRCCS